MGRLLRGPTPETFWQWFGGIWLFVGILFLVIGVALAEYRTVDRLRTEGVVTSGIVLTKSVTRSGTGSSSSSPTYHVTYRFTTADGQVVPGRAEVDVDTWDRLAERGAIVVRYIPASPDSYRVGRLDTDFVPSLALTAVVAVLTSLGGFVCWRAAKLRWSAHEMGRR